ncbi:unnamed protein product [Camellia sinensis]
MLRLLLLLVLFLVSGSTLVDSHKESGDWSCESDPEARVAAEFSPGLVTLDGHADDWKNVDGFEFSLLPALDPHPDHEYKGGKMIVKALHDGKDVYFMLQIDGDYVYSKGDGTKCPSVALMFQVGESATYHDMGGCKESPTTCNSASCHGYEVDIMHFSIGNAVPGRLYGGNPIDNKDGTGGDRFGHLVDVYAWNPHCRNLDGISPSGPSEKHGTLHIFQHSQVKMWCPLPIFLMVKGQHNAGIHAHKGSDGGFFHVGCLTIEHTTLLHSTLGLLGNDSSAQNDWKGAWWHDSFTTHSGFVEEDSPYASAGQKGTYYFEFSRPLRTMDRLQQDVQFTIGQSSKFSVAFWYPVDGNPWRGAQHYSVSCDWVPLDISAGSSALSKGASGNSSSNAASAFALLLSVVAVCVSVFVGYWLFKSKSIPFTPIDHL